MANKTIFMNAANANALALPTNTRNEAGGRAYAFSAEQALAQYAATGTFNHTYYADADEQLGKVLELARAVSPEFLAKTAIYARERGQMKDMPAFLLAVLATRDVTLLTKVFARVIDNGKMLRNFIQIVRSGVVGRKSFGTAPKRLCRAWFNTRSPDAIFRQSIGSAPSLQDVIKMVRPTPKLGEGDTDAVREALYGYLIGKDVPREKLPATVQAFEEFKSAHVQGTGFSAALPNVPFEMLTAFPGDTAFWTRLSERMSFTQLRMNLNTLARHGVFQDETVVSRIAAKIRDALEVRHARVQPFQLLSAYKAAESNADMPMEISIALQEAMEIAIENVTSNLGKVILCPDVSGSMHSPATGFRKGATSKVRCIDIAALITAAYLRRNTSADVLPFSDDVVKMPRKLNPLDSVMTNAMYLASLPSGGTACSAPLRELNRRKATADLVVYVSDNMSWSDFRAVPSKGHGLPFLRSSVMAEEWERFRARNPNAKLVLIDVQPYASTQVDERADVLNVGGFSDAVFDVIAHFAKGELSAEHWIGEIDKISL